MVMLGCEGSGLGVFFSAVVSGTFPPSSSIVKILRTEFVPVVFALNGFGLSTDGDWAT